jgi:hypothetical protein
MRYAAAAAWCLLSVVLTPGRAVAWGFDVHRFIVEQAIPLLPEGLRPFYEKYRVVVVEHSIDPDLWRTVGFEEESPRHYVDLDAYGTYPFAALPRDYDAAVRRFGRETVEKNGLLPWRTAEIFDLLVRAFERVGRGQPFAHDDVKFFSAVLAHYASDAHVPFHAVTNHDGQLTNQRGIHGRFESELFQRYRAQLEVRPVARVPIGHARDFIFDTLLESFQLAPALFEADRRAARGREAYDDEYFDRFFAGARPILERRLAESAAAVAALIAGAWDRAGRPVVPLEPPRPLRKIGR